MSEPQSKFWLSTSAAVWTDHQICAHLDRILKIPQQGLDRDLRHIVRTIRENPNRTVEELANLLYADIMDLNARRDRPSVRHTHGLGGSLA